MKLFERRKCVCLVWLHLVSVTTTWYIWATGLLWKFGRVVSGQSSVETKDPIKGFFLARKINDINLISNFSPNNLEKLSHAHDMADGNGLGKQNETVKESEDEILKR